MVSPFVVVIRCYLIVSADACRRALRALRGHDWNPLNLEEIRQENIRRWETGLSLLWYMMFLYNTVQLFKLRVSLGSVVLHRVVLVLPCVPVDGRSLRSHSLRACGVEWLYHFCQGLTTFLFPVQAWGSTQHA